MIFDFENKNHLRNFISIFAWCNVSIYLFTGGLIHVEGSAGYLRDSIETEDTVAFILKGKYRTQSVS